MRDIAFTGRTPPCVLPESPTLPGASSFIPHRGHCRAELDLRPELAISLLLISMTAPAHAGSTSDLPRAMPADDATCYLDAEAAALSALEVARDLPADVEHGGVVYRIGQDCFVFSNPVTSGSENQVKYVALNGGGFAIAAMYHTHPLVIDGDYFSNMDVLMVQTQGVPSYIYVHGRGEVRRLLPAFVDFRKSALKQDLSTRGRLVAP